MSAWFFSGGVLICFYRQMVEFVPANPGPEEAFNEEHQGNPPDQNPNGVDSRQPADYASGDDHEHKPAQQPQQQQLVLELCNDSHALFRAKGVPWSRF